MKKKFRIQLTLSLVLGLFVMTYCTSFAAAFSNIRYTGYYINRVQRDGKVLVDLPEGVNRGKYERAANNYKFHDHYSTHDWIADSALRLILHSSDSDHKEYVKWLFDENIDLAQWDTREYEGYILSRYWNENNDEFLNYMYFLHGTMWPDSAFSDRPKNKVNIGEEPPGVHILWGSRSQWMHHVYFKYYGTAEDYYSYNHDAMRCANYASNDAETFLTGKRSQRGDIRYRSAAVSLGGMVHFIADVAHPGHVCRVDQWGNIQQIGATNAYYHSHSELDIYVSVQGSTVMKPNKWCEDMWVGEEWPWGDPLWPNDRKDNPLFPKGGPDWSVINPRNLSVHGMTLQQSNPDNLDPNFVITGLQPLPAAVAVYKMAKLTISGWDEENGGDPKQQWVPDDDPKEECGPHSAYRLPTLKEDIDLGKDYSDKFSYNPCTSYQDSCDNTKDRAYALLNWAVYYSACAILDVCERAYKKNGGWPEPSYAQITGRNEARVIMSLGEVINKWNEEQQEDVIMMGKPQENTAVNSVASIGAMTMLTVPLLTISSLIIIIPIFIDKQRSLKDSS